ncbi:phage gp6-like head-tail connector protein [Comamonas sp. NyZ500]|uniref:phage gp6-like head-tail connector protein n=1 Tax=Comamonas sp. NyZ500 TaxID=2795732 RepID=UPI00192C8916|nr:phage gp6-like head-tail connector protein [Comamonas sp. NyZ500]MBL5979050.1 phage gp6-like head-tail connector protein [Comamonas sp. NyZ500]
MARRIRYTGEPVLTLAEVVEWVRADPAAAQSNLITNLIIPTVTAQCEAETGAAIRGAEYVEVWSVGSCARALDVGQANEILSVQPLDGGAQLSPDQYSLQIGQRVSVLTVKSGGALNITYKAGLDLAVYPSVRSWMLMYAATLWAQREVIVQGGVAPLPGPFLGSMLADITVPPRF